MPLTRREDVGYTWANMQCRTGILESGEREFLETVGNSFMVADEFGGLGPTLFW